MAAGLVAGASAGTQAIGNAIYPSDDQAGMAADTDPLPAIATQGPRKLSVLAGNDQAARDSAHSVHVEFAKRPPR